MRHDGLSQLIPSLTLGHATSLRSSRDLRASGVRRTLTRQRGDRPRRYRRRTVSTGGNPSPNVRAR